MRKVVNVLAGMLLGALLGAGWAFLNRPSIPLMGGQPTIEQLDSWIDSRDPLSRAFAEAVLRQILQWAVAGAVIGAGAGPLLIRKTAQAASLGQKATPGEEK